MAHPYSSQAKSSLKARLRRLGATAGKPYGSSSMYKKTSYPKKGAGSATSMTISGNKARSRADRPAQRYADGGSVVTGGKGAGKRKKAHTTNIIISAPGGAGGRGGGGGGGTRVRRRGLVPPVVPPVVRPPIAAPALGGAPALGAAAPPLAAPPVVPRPPIAPVAPIAARPLAAPIVRRPGLAAPAAMPMQKGGVVKKAIGGPTGGRAYAGFPHSPTTSIDSAVSAHKAGGKVGKLANGGPLDKKKAEEEEEEDDDAVDALTSDDAGPPKAGPPPTPSTMGSAHGGSVKKRQRGGLFGEAPGRRPTPPIKGPPTISGRPARPALPLTVPLPGTLAARRTRPAPGTQVGFKKGGYKHEDEAADRKLIKSMLHKEKQKEKRT
jgi:hypothetical protein